MINLFKLLNAAENDRDREKHVNALTKTALSTFPAPVFEVAPEGTVIPANALADALSSRQEFSSVPTIVSAISRARNTGRSQVEVAVIPSAGGSLLFEINVLPQADRGAIVIAKDVTLESNLRTALVESRQRYKDLVEISSEFAWEVDAEGKFVFVSPKGALGYDAEVLVGRPPSDFLAESPSAKGFLPFIADKPIENVEIWMRRHDNSLACLLTSSSPLLDGEGNRRGARGVCRDVTRERERDAALARANNRERLLTYIVRTVRDVVDPSDMLKAAAEAVAHALGASGCEIFRYRDRTFLLGASFGSTGDSAPVIAAFSIEDKLESRVGKSNVLARVTRYRHDVNGGIAMWRDEDSLEWTADDRLLLDDVADQIGIANEQIANHESILALSRTDSLTGLFNRRAFFEELARRFARLEHDKKIATLIYLDLDNFKLVNDLFGHRRGDEALLAVRDILMRHTRPNDLLARLGGDEFALWLEGADQTIAYRRCDEMIEAAKAIAHFSGSVSSPLTLSMGVAIHHPEEPESLGDLLARADDAMYAAKREGKCAYRLADAPTSRS